MDWYFSLNEIEIDDILKTKNSIIITHAIKEGESSVLSGTKETKEFLVENEESLNQLYHQLMSSLIH
jgi:hypothetical protein